MAHTPGPWTAFNADYQAIHEDSLLPIFVVGPREFHTVAQVRAGNDDDGLPAETAANAALIATAPDLLAALKATREHLALFCTTEDAIAAEIFRIADAAIAKAEAQ